MFCFFFTPVLRLGLRFGIQITTNAHTNLRNDNGNNKNIQREWERRRGCMVQVGECTQQISARKRVGETVSKRVYVHLIIRPTPSAELTSPLLMMSSCTKTNLNCAQCLVLCAVYSFGFFSSWSVFNWLCPVLSLFCSRSLLLCVRSEYCLNCLHCLNCLYYLCCLNCLHCLCD